MCFHPVPKLFPETFPIAQRAGYEGERSENRLEKWGRYNSSELLSTSVCCRDYATSHVVRCGVV
jgi:hypothetical protein